MQCMSINIREGPPAPLVLRAARRIARGSCDLIESYWNHIGGGGGGGVSSRGGGLVFLSWSESGDAGCAAWGGVLI